MNDHQVVEEVGKAYSGSTENEQPNVTSSLLSPSASDEVKIETLQSGHTGDNEQNQDGVSLDVDVLLCRAASMNRVDIVRLCLQRKASPCSKDSTGRTPLHHAACGGSVDVLNVLLESLTSALGPHMSLTKAIIDAPDPKGWTPLHLAVCRKSTTIAEILLDHGADPYCKLAHALAPSKGSKKCESMPIHFAAVHGCQEIVEKLLSLNAPIDSLDSALRTPLHYAAYHTNADFVGFLLEHGASHHAADENERTPLHVAASGGKVEIAKRLLEAGASLKAMDRWDFTPVALAATREEKEMVDYLLSKMSPSDREVYRSSFEKTEERSPVGSSFIESEMDTIERTVVMALVTSLKEPNRILIARAVKRMGTRFCLDLYEETLNVQHQGGMMTNGRERQRTLGGIFIFLLRQKLSDRKPQGLDDWKYIIQEGEEKFKAQKIHKRKCRREVHIHQYGQGDCTPKQGAEIGKSQNPNRCKPISSQKYRPPSRPIQREKPIGKRKTSSRPPAAYPFSIPPPPPPREFQHQPPQAPRQFQEPRFNQPFYNSFRPS